MSDVLDRPRIIAEPSGVPGAGEVLTEAALDFLAELHERFDGRRRALLDARVERQASFDAGELPDFPKETLEIRASDWTVGSIPHDLTDRRVEITGPTNAKMLINAGVERVVYAGNYLDENSRQFLAAARVKLDYLPRHRISDSVYAPMPPATP